MARLTHRRTVTLATVLALVLLLPATTGLARTEVDRFQVDETIEDDPFWTDMCGLPVDLHVEVRISHKAFSDDPPQHRQEEQGRVTFTSDHGAAAQVFHHAGIHEVVEILEDLEPDVFLVRVEAEANGNLWVEDANGKRLALDAGAVTFDDIGIWDRAANQLIGPLESTVARVAGPHPLLDPETMIPLLCGELTP